MFWVNQTPRQTGTHRLSLSAHEDHLAVRWAVRYHSLLSARICYQWQPAVGGGGGEGGGGEREM